MRVLRIGAGLIVAAAGIAWGQQFSISTYAGGAGPPTPLPGAQASVGAVQGVVTDSSGNVYFSSRLGCVFKLDTAGTLTRFAGTCRPGYTAGDGGPAANAEIFDPVGLAMDGAGNLYIADVYPSDRVRKVSPSGVITIVAGSGLSSVPGNGVAAIDSPLELSDVSYPAGLAADAAGNLYIASTQFNCVSKVSAATGLISTFAGTCSGTAAGFSGDSGLATAAKLRGPTGVAVDSSGNVYIADEGNYRVRMVSTSGTINTIAGTGQTGSTGDNGPAASASLAPSSLSFDASGNLLINDTLNSRVRKITNGTIITVAGGGPLGLQSFGGDGGPATSANLYHPYGVAADRAGNIYIADQGNNRLRRVSPTGTINTIVGDGLAYSGDRGQATNAQLFFPAGVAVDASGNLYIGEYDNNRVRKVTPSGVISTVAGDGTRTIGNTTGSVGDQGPAIKAQVTPLGVAVDSSGNLYIADFGNERIRKVTPGGTITTIAGTGATGYFGDGGQATAAILSSPAGIVLDNAGNVYFADSQNHRVRKVTPGGVISTVAGNGGSGCLGDGGQAIDAVLAIPYFLALDSKGNLYISDLTAGVVRKVTPAGIISTYAGYANCSSSGNAGEGGPATQVGIGPFGIATDAADNLYIADDTNMLIRVVSPATGAIATAAGQQIGEGFPGSYIGDGGIATAAQITSPQGLAVDSKGNVYIGDVEENAVRVLMPDTPVGLTITAGNNQTAQAGYTLPYPLQVVVNGSTGVPVPGVSVAFTVSSGSGAVPANAVSDATGTASVALMLGPNPGTVMVTATAANLQPVQFTATAVAAPASGGVACTLTVPPSITSVNSATDFGGFSSFAPGSWLEVKGANLAVDTRLWSGNDFQGVNAPTSLDGSSVAIDGNAGFVDYISGAQINVQAPADSNTGPVKITVTTCAGTSTPVAIPEAATVPGMLAPASFFVPGNPPEIIPNKQYLVALYGDGRTFVGNPSLIPGVPFRPATPGDTITAYGIGFGAVTPAIAPGVIVGQSNSIPNLTISFGQTPAVATYAGLAPNAVGLYQFNITVPQLTAGDYLINVSVNGVAVPQTFYLTVQ